MADTIRAAKSTTNKVTSESNPELEQSENQNEPSGDTLETVDTQTILSNLSPEQIAELRALLLPSDSKTATFPADPPVDKARTFTADDWDDETPGLLPASVNIEDLRKEPGLPKDHWVDLRSNRVYHLPKNWNPSHGNKPKIKKVDTKFGNALQQVIEQYTLA